jgi:hypothetical protein
LHDLEPLCCYPRSVCNAQERHHVISGAFGIAGFLAQLRHTVEQLDPVQRWYRILSEALKRYLKGRQLDPPRRLVQA